MLVLANTKLVARLPASDFPSENPRTQTRNFPYTNTLPVMVEKHSGKKNTLEKKLIWDKIEKHTFNNISTWIDKFCKRTN